MAAYPQIASTFKFRPATLQDHWRIAYAWQRSNPTSYCVARDHRITDALRALFVKTEGRRGQMNSGAPASHLVTALHHPLTGVRLSRWKM